MMRRVKAQTWLSASMVLSMCRVIGTAATCHPYFEREEWRPIFELVKVSVQ